MYIQITTRCNMRCAHCCFACTSKGEDMSETTFQQAVQQAVENGEAIVIGGGEPTVHPKFWQFLGYAMSKSDEIWLATNGKRTDDALALARLARQGVIGVALSLDKWHEPINPRVIDAFKRQATFDPKDDDRREYRDVGKFGLGPIRAGRWKKGNRIECPCAEVFVKPSGDVYHCGCHDSPQIGHVTTGYEEAGGCYNSPEHEVA